MTSPAQFGSIATQQGSPAVTTTYGSEAADWTTKAMPVGPFGKLVIEGTIGAGFTAAQLDLLVLAADENYADLDAFVRHYELNETSGLMEPKLEFSFDLTLPEIIAERNFLMCLDVSGFNQIRVAAKVDAGALDLTLRYTGDDTLGGIFKPKDVV